MKTIQDTLITNMVRARHKDLDLKSYLKYQTQPVVFAHIGTKNTASELARYMSNKYGIYFTEICLRFSATKSFWLISNKYDPIIRQLTK